MITNMYDNDVIYEDVCSETIISLEDQINLIRQLKKYPPPFTDFVSLSSTISNTNCNGVYKILYEPENLVYYIGQGNIGARKNRHIERFYDNVNRYDVSTKMKEKDSDINNWYFSFCDVKSKILAKEYESRLISIVNPYFNDIRMAGTG